MGRRRRRTPRRRKFVMPLVKRRRGKKRPRYNLSITRNASVIVPRRRIRRIYHRKPRPLSKIPWFSCRPEQPSPGLLSRQSKLSTSLQVIKPYFENRTIAGGIGIALEVCMKILLVRQFFRNSLSLDRSVTNPFQLLFRRARGNQGDLPSLQADLSVMLYLMQRYRGVTQQPRNRMVAAVAANRGLPRPLLVMLVVALIASTWSRASDDNFVKPFREFFVRLIAILFDGLGAAVLTRLSRRERRHQRRSRQGKRYLSQEMQTSAMRLRAWNYFMTTRDVRAARMNRARRRWISRLIRRMEYRNRNWEILTSALRRIARRRAEEKAAGEQTEEQEKDKVKQEEKAKQAENLPNRQETGGTGGTTELEVVKVTEEAEEQSLGETLLEHGKQEEGGEAKQNKEANEVSEVKMNGVTKKAREAEPEEKKVLEEETEEKMVEEGEEAEEGEVVKEVDGVEGKKETKKDDDLLGDN